MTMIPPVIGCPLMKRYIPAMNPIPAAIQLTGMKPRLVITHSVGMEFLTCSLEAEIVG